MKIEAAWFNKAMEAHEGGIDVLYNYGIRYLTQHHKDFYFAKHHKVKPYDAKYIPNPYRYTYDLTMFIWINYYKILKEEIKILRKLDDETTNLDYGKQAEELANTRVLYGITRSDFLFAAAEMRWPTTILENGAHHGLFIRDPWSERRVNALSDEYYKNVIGFGGGGQGKTHVSLAVALMLFDYFIFTQKGARCMISTVNKDKLDSVSWAYLCNLNSATKEGISLYAGRAKIAGDHTLARPGNKDRGGVFKGILIGNQMNDQSIIDKLTGSHGHPFLCYILDELQSTPNPPIVAAPNYTMHAGDHRIIGAGNFGENNDTLAKNIKPDIGWENVDESTGTWISTMENGSKAIVLHFNNNLSPGMTPEGNRLYPHLPSKKILDAKYPDINTRNSANISYKRFWVGFRVPDSGNNSVIFEALVKENLADAPLDLSKVLHNFFTFDSAQAEQDRNLAVACREGVCAITKQRVFGPHLVYPLVKATEGVKYYQESANQLREIAKKNNIMSGCGIVDWTGRPAQAEMLQQQGFIVQKLIFNKAIPDGKRTDALTKRVEREIRLGVQLDFNNDIKAADTCAHHVAENQISLGAWALQQYIKVGRVRGINDALIEYTKGKRSLEQELYNRRYYLKNSAIYGSRFELESKKQFRSDYGFSPDLLDNLFMMAFYMLVYRKLPLTPIGNDAMLLQDEDEEVAVTKDHDDLWYRDGLDDLYVG